MVLISPFYALPQATQVTVILALMQQHLGLSAKVVPVVRSQHMALPCPEAGRQGEREEVLLLLLFQRLQ